MQVLEGFPKNTATKSAGRKWVKTCVRILEGYGEVCWNQWGVGAVVAPSWQLHLRLMKRKNQSLNQSVKSSVASKARIFGQLSENRLFLRVREPPVTLAVVRGLVF